MKEGKDGQDDDGSVDTDSDSGGSVYMEEKTSDSENVDTDEKASYSESVDTTAEAPDSDHEEVEDEKDKEGQN